MRTMTFLLISILSHFTYAEVAKAPPSQEALVEKSVATLTAAMISGNEKDLKAITLADLSYGHSGGTIETKKDFVGNIVSGQSDFVAIDILKQTVQINGDTALVRHDLDAKTNNRGKPGTVYLGVLLVLQKNTAGEWKLLARQAFKYPKDQH